jgi:hypothetical protein
MLPRNNGIYLQVRTAKQPRRRRWLSSGLQRRVVRSVIALMMEAARTSETSVNFYQTTRRCNPEDSHLRTHRRENFKSSPEEHRYVGKSFVICQTPGPRRGHWCQMRNWRHSQRSDSGELAIIVTLCVHFPTCFISMFACITFIFTLLLISYFDWSSQY